MLPGSHTSRPDTRQRALAQFCESGGAICDSRRGALSEPQQRRQLLSAAPRHSPDSCGTRLQRITVTGQLLVVLCRSSPTFVQAFRAGSTKGAVNRPGCEGDRLSIPALCDGVIAWSPICSLDDTRRHGSPPIRGSHTRSDHSGRRLSPTVTCRLSGESVHRVDCPLLQLCCERAI